MSTVLNQSPIFSDMARTGKQKFWRLRLVQDGELFGVQKEWWQEGSKVQLSVPRWSTPRSCDTAKLQAEFEFASAITRKQERASSGFAKPMLANSFRDRKDRITWPVYVQPKYDGHRMLMDGHQAWTRGQKEHKPTVSHLIFDTEGYILDGEVMLPKNPLLQHSSSAIKGKVGKASQQLHYFVYDVMIDAPYSERLALLIQLLEDVPPCVELAPTFKVTNEEEVLEYHAKFVAVGFEGCIIRTNTSGYEHTRTSALLKLKDFQDAEFQVVDVEEGKGSATGHAILVCTTKAGVEFRAMPEGTHEYRASLWARRATLIGKWLTVRYQTLSENGIPTFPIGVDFREEGE